jgi:hypothetical protein
MFKFVIFILSFTVGILFIVLTIKKGRKKMEKKCVVDIEQNMQTGTWVATSKDVLGLILMSESKDDLKKQVERAAPELLRLNKIDKFGKNPLIEYCEREILVPAI